MADSGSVIDWLLDSDPSIRWQVMRDLLDTPEPQWRAERAKVATEGWGARLLAYEDEDGQWAGGAFIPRDFEAREWHQVGQPWTATSFSLSQLREFGLDPSSAPARRAVTLIGASSRWEEGGQPFWEGEVDPGQPAGRRASRGRRLELRAGQRLGAHVVRHDHQRAGRAPGVRTGHRRDP
jgi:hypothetical protein